MLAEHLHYIVKYRDGAFYATVYFPIGTTQESIEETFREMIMSNNEYQLKHAGHTLYMIDRQCFKPLY